MPLVALIEHVTLDKTCAIGKFHDRNTDTCKICTDCPEITRRVCHQDKDSVCASFKEVFLHNPRFFMYKDSAKQSIQSAPNAREKTQYIDVIREYRWQHMTLSLTCILCMLCTVLVVLVVVACMLYRKSRKESPLHIQGEYLSSTQPLPAANSNSRQEPASAKSASIVSAKPMKINPLHSAYIKQYTQPK